MSTMSMLGEVRPEHDQGTDGDQVLLHYLRSFRWPVLEVWSACTERRQLAQWLGVVSGEKPCFTVEPMDGPTAGPIEVRVEHCRSPHELAIRIDGCVTELRLTQVGVVTNLELIRRHLCHGDAGSVGPRWQYLLDRLTAHLDRQQLPAWSKYPKRVDEYR